MDFFEHQQRARRLTGKLALLFLLALGFLIVALYLVVRGLTIWAHGLNPYGELASLESRQLETGIHLQSLWQWDAPTFWWVTFGTLAIVLLGSIYKVLQLQKGGAAVARSLGGRLITRSAPSRQERQLLNVVAELAVAAGIKSPAVYSFDCETGINAFTAGFRPDDAVIGVTRGSLDLLSREELQGIIAHEISHILNGDMRMNLQLLGLIHGIVVIGLVGRSLMQDAAWGRRPGRMVGNTKARGLSALIILGGIITAIGYIGVLFGSLIKAAVSRQREFLADASAVQLTRYPAGLSGALKKIGGFAEGSTIRHPGGMAISHMFFSQGVSRGIDRVFATHPSLTERIRRIDPQFDGRFPAVKPPTPDSSASASGIQI